MSDAARRLLLVVAIVLTVVVGAVWLLDRDDDADPPTATWRCLDAYHRPLENQPTQHTVAVGVDVVGSAPAYRVSVTIDGITASADQSGLVLIPVGAQTATIAAVEVVAVGESDDAEPIDVSAELFGERSGEIELPDAGGPADPALGPCEQPPSVHPGYPFAAPTPPFGAGSPAVAAVADEAAALVAALAGGDPAVAMELLHPASIDGYGEEICRAHVESAIPAMPALETQAVATVSDYRFHRPGGEDQLDDVVLVEAMTDGVPWRFNLARHEGELRWLSWCGN
ncbi:MAG: hypothetical protein OES57_08915 [Acidimicrobiia bacterium]|nr:hypothetical protein [Acidimicrobiia bacterium]